MHKKATLVLAYCLFAAIAAYAGQRAANAYKATKLNATSVSLLNGMVGVSGERR